MNFPLFVLGAFLSLWLICLSGCLSFTHKKVGLIRAGGAAPVPDIGAGTEAFSPDLNPGTH